MVERILSWGDFIVICIILILIAIIFYYVLFCTLGEHKVTKVDSKENKFAILIPARDESKVIESILISIENQTLKQDMKDVYVIVESNEDPTVEISKKHNATVFVRTNLENRRRKGYALDECIKDILSKGIKYDGYFIFDADNVLDKNYLFEMNNTFNDGYDLACGYRHPSNPNQNVIATCSSLIFSMINVFGNYERAKKNYNVNITGTGFFIRSHLVEEWNGYPFHSLTEDYELSLYATWKNLPTYYNENAIYYDEQPSSRKQSYNQRLRWVKGYFESRKQYSKKIKEASKDKSKNISKTHALGVVPYIIMVGLMVAYLIFLISISIIASMQGDYQTTWDACSRIIGVIVGIYLVMALLAVGLFFVEGKKVNYTLKTKIKSIFYYPIFLTDFLFIVIRLLFKRDVSWVKIEHGNDKNKLDNKKRG